MHFVVINTAIIYILHTPPIKEREGETSERVIVGDETKNERKKEPLTLRLNLGLTGIFRISRNSFFICLLFKHFVIC